MRTLSQDFLNELKEYYQYNAETGIFIRLKVCNKGCLNLVGKEAGTNRHGYVQLSHRGIRIDAHRLAWYFIYGYFPVLVDHKNGKPSDNRIDNLRDTSYAVNNTNKKISKSSCGFLGVTFAKGKYQASLMHKGKSHYLGRYSTPEEAHAVYMKAKAEMYPEESWAICQS